MPIMWMLVLGFAFSEDHEKVYLIGVEKSLVQLPAITKLVERQDIRMDTGDEASLKKKLITGDISVILKGAPEGFVFVYDPKNKAAGDTHRYVADILQTQAGRIDPLPISRETVATIGQRYIDFLVPGLLGLSVMTTSLFGVAMTLVSNRRENLLKRYLVTPMPRSVYIVSHVLGRIGILAVEFFAVMLSAYLLFDFTVAGSLIDFFVFTAIGAAAFTGLAVLCAARTRSVPAVSGVTNLITFPLMMLGGVFFSIKNFPEWSRPFIEVLPLTALNDGLRKIALEGASITALGFEIAILLSLLIVTSATATRLFRWY